MNTEISYHDHLKQAESSGLTFAEYGQQNGIDPQRLYSLKSQLRSRAKPKPKADFKRIEIQKIKSCHLNLPNGIKVEMDEHNFDFACRVIKMFLSE